MAPNSYAIIGDVHGEVELLQALLEFDSVRQADVVLLLGDLIGGTLSSKNTVERLLKWRTKLNKLLLLRGNHEAALLDYLEDSDFLRYALDGGLPVLRSYLCGDAYGDVHAQFVQKLPSTHRMLFEETESWFETSNFFCSHAAVNGPASRSNSERGKLGLSEVESVKSKNERSKLAIYGHYQVGSQPVWEDSFVCIDTGCGFGGPLTALLLPQRKFVQVRRSGNAVGLSIFSA